MSAGDGIVAGPHAEQRVERAMDDLGVEPARTVEAGELRAARAAGVALTIGVPRGTSSPEQLRDAGADAVVADLQELLHAV
jgi:phosphoglycolate phosphatase-like HAD superfamily hydrolase